MCKIKEEKLAKKVTILSESLRKEKQTVKSLQAKLETSKQKNAQLCTELKKTTEVKAIFTTYKKAQV